MKQTTSFLGSSLLLALVMFSGFYGEAKTENLPTDITLVGSTPGDELIKSLLRIPPTTKVDFIRWNLALTGSISGKKTFALKINYGEGQPNTPGFINGGEKKSIRGEYNISHSKGSINGDVYHLKSDKLPTEILMIKLNDNIFHLLTPQKQLMIGNGGWSYTLNRKEPLSNVSTDLPALTMSSGLASDTAQQIAFEGRTPCADIAREINITVGQDCYKLKWYLVLNKDPRTLKPTTYTLKRTGHRQSDITGKWTIKKGISNPNVRVCQLDPDKPEESISLLLGDDNVAFFLDKNNKLFIGNEDFSYTLNRDRKSK